MNQTILQDLRTRLDEACGKELPSMLWAYHTSPQTLTNETPFNVVFGTKMVIPVKISLPTIRIEHYDELSNQIRLRANLDLIEGLKIAYLYMAAYRQ